MVAFPEAGLQVLALFLLLFHLETLLRGLLEVGDVIYVHDIHVNNIFHPLVPEVSDQKVLLLLILHLLHW